jgi:general secretion pathway protein I
MASKPGRSVVVTKPGAAQRAAGFTLLEVVVAVTIAGLALVGLFQAGSGGLFAANLASRLDEAVERAQSHLAAFGRSGALAPAEIEGDDGGGYHWRLRARPIVTEQGAAAGQTGSGMTLFDVEVEISWRAWGRTRSVVLDTRRLGAAPAPE